MATCQTAMVSILNNDDHPSFVVRPLPKLSKQQSPSLTYSPQSTTYDYRYSTSSNSYRSSSTLTPLRLDPLSLSGAAHSRTLGLADYSYSSRSGPLSLSPYATYTRGLSQYPYPPRPLDRISQDLPSPVEPPSPQTSYGSPTDLSTPRGHKKNKYPCPYAASHGCSATFTTSGHAARHGKKHTGEKSVHCPICNKAFTRKDNMKQHRRTHRTHSEETPTRLDLDKDSKEWAKSREMAYNNSRAGSQSQSDGDDYYSVNGSASPTEERPYGASEIFQQQQLRQSRARNDNKERSTRWI